MTHLFGHLKARLNGAPLLLTPGFAVIGYVADGAHGVFLAIAGWLAIVVGATLSVALHAGRDAEARARHPGRRAFDFKSEKLGR